MVYVPNVYGVSSGEKRIGRTKDLARAIEDTLKSIGEVGVVIMDGNVVSEDMVGGR